MLVLEFRPSFKSRRMITFVPLIFCWCFARTTQNPSFFGLKHFKPRMLKTAAKRGSRAHVHRPGKKMKSLGNLCLQLPLKLVFCSYQCSRAVGYVITSQSHNTGQDAALHQPWPYPKAWRTLSSTPELVYCTWQSTARLYTAVTQTGRRGITISGFTRFRPCKNKFSPGNVCFVDSCNLWHQWVIRVRVT